MTLLDGICDLHVHGAPSLMPRHGPDHEVVGDHASAGVRFAVLKAHEGSTAERAALAAAHAATRGVQVVGGVVLNSPVGGANPDAVTVAARLGARVVWLPTVSAPAHKAASASSELAVHAHLSFREVPVLDDAGRVRPEWRDVLDVVAEHDLVLASGHLSCTEALTVFRAAREAGVRRLLVNHPRMPFLGWDDAAAPEFAALGAHLELGILPDLLTDGPPSTSLGAVHPAELLAFGGDLGHADHPTLARALPDWLAGLERAVGARAAEDILTRNGRELVEA